MTPGAGAEDWKHDRATAFDTGINGRKGHEGE